MAASACLRIVLDLTEEKLARLDALGPLVAKVTSAFLETRWSWPRRYEALDPFSFMLVDPKAAEVDIARLERLAEELQLKLFGTSNAGDVTLFLFDGDEIEIGRFMSMNHAQMRAAARKPEPALPLVGRLLTVSTRMGASSPMRWRAISRPVGFSDLESGPQARAFDCSVGCFRGVYFTPRESFVGCGVSSAAAAELYSLIDEAEMLPLGREFAFDLASATIARRALAKPDGVGVLFLSASFSMLMRRSTRLEYEALFETLPREHRNRLAIVIYDAPRSPAFHALAELNDLLAPHFSVIDLQVSDAGFEIDWVPVDTLNSVTLRLPDGDERQRLAALKRFMDKRDSFKRRRIWPAITNVRSRRELKACLAETVPFVSGHAVCAAMETPFGGVPLPPDALPLTEPGWLGPAW